MLNFDFKKSSRKCSESERTLLPGEHFFSALVDSGDDTERKDFCEEAWQGPPEDCIGWWKAKIPEAGKGRVYWAPRHVLLAYFEHVNGQANQDDIAFITGSLLTQKKILTLEDSYEEDGREYMQLKNRKNNESHQVVVIDVQPQRLAEIQEELAERLFMDEPYDADADVDAETEPEENGATEAT
jgi:hypothetical protein